MDAEQLRTVQAPLKQRYRLNGIREVRGSAPFGSTRASGLIAGALRCPQARKILLIVVYCVEGLVVLCIEIGCGLRPK
jgi:hypothetical protein